jgi:hypothetical protein
MAIFIGLLRFKVQSSRFKDEKIQTQTQTQKQKQNLGSRIKKLKFKPVRLGGSKNKT